MPGLRFQIQVNGPKLAESAHSPVAFIRILCNHRDGDGSQYEGSSMPRNSVRLQGEAGDALRAEMDRDRAKVQASIDYFRDLIGVLKDGRNEDLEAVDSFTANMKMMINRRHDGVAEQLKVQVAREEAHLRDLDGNEPEKPALAEAEAGDGKVTRITKKVAS
jgi:hypothetical protein